MAQPPANDPYRSPYPPPSYPYQSGDPPPRAPAPPPPPRLSMAQLLEADRAVVRSKDFIPEDSASSPFGGGESLIAIKAVCAGTADGRCQQVFFFVDARYLGTDTLTAS